MIRLPILCTVFVVACGQAVTSPGNELPFANATNDCGPTDAPAVSFSFTETPLPQSPPRKPYLTLTIARSIDLLAGETYRIGGGGTYVYGEFQTVNDARAGVVTGTIRVNAIARDSSIIGALDLTFVNGARLSREFSAPWRRTPILCG